MDYRQRFFVDPDHALHLHSIDTADTGPHETEKAAADELDQYLKKLSHQQILLFAERKHSLLIVLQALDAGGKDGTIKHVFGAFNPQGATVTGFKVPTPIELEHDFLWRVHPHAPGRGQIAIFNRSHYEDVLVTRVHKLIDKHTWTERYDLIRGFERGLVASGTQVVKFFLHVSKQEQLKRFEQRIEDPARNWKINESDYAERQYWDAYMEAYQDALTATSSKHAPWYVIPADHKWFRNLAVSQIVAETLDDLHMAFPKASVDLAELRRKYHLNH